MYYCSFRCFVPFLNVPIAFVFSVRDLITTIQLLVVIPITPLPPAREMLHLIFFFFSLFFILASMFTSDWRKLRAKVGHAWDKCCYICQRNQTTQLTGTIHAHHVRGWEVSVQPDNCLQAMLFFFVCLFFLVNNTPVYTDGAHSVHNLFCSHSRFQQKKKEGKIKKNFSCHFIPFYWKWWTIFLKLCWGNYTSLNKRSFFVKLLQLATTLNSIRHFIVYWATFSLCWSALFLYSFYFFCRYL